MSWIILILAGLCEVAFAFCIGQAKTAVGSPHWYWLGAFVFFYILSMVLLAKAVHSLPLSTAYPIWTGIGAVGTVLLGIFFFHEPATFWRIFFICTLIISIVGLKTLS